MVHRDYMLEGFAVSIRKALCLRDMLSKAEETETKSSECELAALGGLYPRRVLARILKSGHSVYDSLEI